MDMKSNSVDKNLQVLKDSMKADPVASFLDMRVVELKAGYSKVSLKLIPEYQNFGGFVFGGIIMAVADQAFGYASNSIAYPGVASQFNIHFLNGPAADDTLTAECRVVKSGRRAIISEITVTNQENKLIAKATGTTIPLLQNEQ